MSPGHEVGLEQSFRLLAASVRGGKRALGLDEGWSMPLAIFDAETGFGEEAWLEASPATMLATRVTNAPVTWRCGRHAGRTSGAWANSVLQPKGTPNDSSADAAVRFAHIYLRDSLVDRVADSIRPGAAVSGSLRDDLIFAEDRRLDHLASRYLAATTTGASLLELEANAILLVSHLLREHHGFDDQKPLRGGLAPWQLKRACEAIDAHIDEDFGLDMLAGIAGCSPTHFSRAFKQSTGLPPFQWLLERRVERAKELLAEGRLPLAEIALAVGFSAQPQFTTAFKRMTGTTPGSWRRERLS